MKLKSKDYLELFHAISDYNNKVKKEKLYTEKHSKYLKGLEEKMVKLYKKALKEE